MVLSFQTRGLLIGESAPEALSSLLAESAGDYFRPQAGVSLVRSDVVDAGVAVPVVIPVKVSCEVGGGFAVVQEVARIFRGAFNGGEGGFDEGIVVGGSGPGEELGHVAILAELADRFGFHLAAAVVEQFGALVFRQVEAIFLFQSAFEEQAGLGGGPGPADLPMDRLAGKLIEQQIEEKADAFLPRQQVADVPTPTLIGTGQLLAAPGTSEWPLCRPPGPRAVMRSRAFNIR